MATTNPQVMAMVERELAAAPDTSTSDLFDKAQAMNPAMKELSIRQFHARYPLQVKRLKSLAEGGGRRRKKRARKRATASGARSAGSSRVLQGVLLQFARAVSEANDRGPTAMLEFVANLDEWVAKVERARS